IILIDGETTRTRKVYRLAWDEGAMGDQGLTEKPPGRARHGGCSGPGARTGGTLPPVRGMPPDSDTRDSLVRLLAARHAGRLQQLGHDRRQLERGAVDGRGVPAGGPG